MRHLINLAQKKFSNLSLREVAREAGIAPTSFYRHFSDMDELGLEMVDEAGLMLRQLMRQARKRIDAGGSVISVSVDTFLNLLLIARTFSLAITRKFRHFSSFSYCGSTEIKHFVDELAEYISYKHQYSQYVAYVQAEGIVTIVFTAGANALDMSKAEREQLKARVILQLRMLAKGADFAANKERGK